ncbi:MAG: thioredoxin [Zavarzinella sp.]
MANEHVHEFTEGKWTEEVVNSDVPVVVDFWAPWCGPCRALSPIIDKVAASFAGKVKVGKLNTDENPDVAAQYSVNTIPRIMIFKGSDQPVKSMVGLQSEQALSDAINSVL